MKTCVKISEDNYLVLDGKVGTPCLKFNLRSYKLVHEHGQCVQLGSDDRLQLQKCVKGKRIHAVQHDIYWMENAKWIARGSESPPRLHATSSSKTNEFQRVYESGFGLQMSCEFCLCIENEMFKIFNAFKLYVLG